MQEVFEKIIEKLEELKNHYNECCLVDYNEGAAVGLTEAMNIVRQAAAEDNNGWIPCSERLPEDLNDKNIDCFLVTDGFLIWMAYYNSEIGWQFAECTNSRNKIDWTEIIAWQPLPQPYEPKED